MLTNEDGEIAMSFIGRFESLQEDLNKVLGRLGEPEVLLKKTNVTQNQKPHLLASLAFIDELVDKR